MHLEDKHQQENTYIIIYTYIYIYIVKKTEMRIISIVQHHLPVHRCFLNIPNIPSISGAINSSTSSWTSEATGATWRDDSSGGRVYPNPGSPLP